MIKIFNATDTNFNTAGNIVVNPLYCKETKKKSLNGWYIDVEIPIKYKEYIEADKLCVVKTKSKLKPQAFRICENIKYTTQKIKFTAEHVMFDSRRYILLDVRPTNLNALNGLNYINARTDNVSPFSFSSDVENVNTAYFIRKNLLEAWETFEERWGGVFDADNWNISFKQKVGNDNGAIIAYRKNMQGFEIYEDWSNVCNKVLAVGPNGLVLPEVYRQSDVQYDIPYTKIVDFQTELENDEQTESNLITELRTNANKYLEENSVPKVSYTINSNIEQDLEIGDTIKVLHPFVTIFTEVLEYEYNLISKKVEKLTFGNYTRDVKTKFENIKNSINKITQAVSRQNIIINNQTNLINSLNKNGYVYIDENEILLLDKLPKEEAEHVWRFGLGGIGYSSNGYEGPFEIAITQDGQINADFISTGTLAVSRIEGLGDTITQMLSNIDDQNQKISIFEQALNSLKSQISEVADVTISGDGYGSVGLDNINESEPVRIELRPRGEDISYLYPRDNLYPSNTLFLKNRKLRFATESYVIDYELPTDLLYYDSENYDEFILDYEGQSCIVNKKVAYNADGTKYLLENPTTLSFPYPNIPLEPGNYTVTVLGYPSAYIFARLMVQNIYTTQFATKSEMKSTIEQKANSITSTVAATYETKTDANNKFATKDQLATTKTEIKQTTDTISAEVSKKVDDTDFIKANIILKLNDNTSEAKIKAGIIELDANDILNILAGNEINLTSKKITFTAQNLSIDEDGKLTCAKATFKDGELDYYSSSGTHLGKQNVTTYTTDTGEATETISLELESTATIPSYIVRLKGIAGDILQYLKISTNDISRSFF